LKHGKRLKRRHKSFLSDKGLNHKNFLMVKDTPELIEFVTRDTGKSLVFRYER